MVKGRKLSVAIAILIVVEIILCAMLIFCITYKDDGHSHNSGGVNATLEDEGSGQKGYQSDAKDGSNGTVSKTVSQGIGNLITNTVDITIDKEMLELSGEPFDYVLTQEQKNSGFTKIKKNNDGSATFTIKKKDYEKFISEMKKTTKQGIDEIAADGSFPAIKSITYNDDLSKIVITADKQAFENSFSSAVVFSCGLASCMYQMYDIDADGKCTIEVKDSASGEIFQTTVYPDDLNNTK